MLIVAVAAVALGALAQNANRSGIFVELGGGMVAGTTPTYKIECDHGVLKGYNLTGFGANFGAGYRIAVSRACAVEVKAEASAGMKSIGDTYVIGILPGFRYTTREILGNMSMYFGVNGGVSFSNGVYRVGSYSSDIDINAVQEIYLGRDMKIGGSYGLTVGLNFTNSFYGGLFWDGYLCTEGLRGLENKLLHWGTAGLRLGFRF